MKKNELQSIIREELRKTLKEAKALPKELNVKHISGNKYVMYYTKYNWEPSIAELEKAIAMVHKTLKTKGDLVGLIKISATSWKPNPTVFVIDGDVCIGDEFTSRMKPAEMDDSVGLTNDEY